MKEQKFRLRATTYFGKAQALSAFIALQSLLTLRRPPNPIALIGKENHLGKTSATLNHIFICFFL